MIDRIEQSILAFLLASMTLVTFSQVVARYAFNAGAVWALELTTYLFAWLVLFGMSYGVKTGAHLGVDAFVKLFAPRTQKAITLLAAACCLAYATILLIGAFEYVSKIYRIGIPTEDLYVPRVIVEFLTGVAPEDYEEVPVPRWIPYMILPIGLALLFYRFAEATILILRGRRAGLTASHEAEELVREHRLDDDGPVDRPGA